MGFSGHHWQSQSIRDLITSQASSSFTESLPTSPEFGSLLFVDSIAGKAGIEDAVRCCQLQLVSDNPKSAVLGAFNILFQSAFLPVATDIDYIKEAIRIVQGPLNLSRMELSSFPAAQVLLTFLCIHSKRIDKGM